ncbi:hypothetical protein CU097_002122 [Rhizopus azygosporus]|uniref:Uncharacterized protein n=2 Tax=Rhizopus TaxID=4842 RepID=A0A367JF63_RHIAZ|nr:hypothetical protein CU097_002122 [Rhizopus azygosporus]
MSESTIHREASNDPFNGRLLVARRVVPGSDLISKAILTDDRIINIICKSLNNSPQDHYMAAPSEFLNKSACDVLYLPKVALSEYPPIIVEVQKNVNEKYSKYPIILIIGVSTAKRCLLMSSITLSKNGSTEQLDPLAAISMFLCSQKLSITHLDCGSDDSTMKLLYKVAMTYVQQLVGEETEKAEVIQLICDNTENQIEKIKRCIQQG